ncbi:MAG TPA: signal recognition particle receptor subunit alpha, partial [Candidatus Norongarragalinales archaeon]|nr:signal recognition particle receptor subunit alpha [Candidatus Norongarragalinales archaeon]
MFGFLKKAVSGFVEKLSGKEKEKAEEPKHKQEEKIEAKRGSIEEEIFREAEKEVLKTETPAKLQAVFEHKPESKPEPMKEQPKRAAVEEKFEPQLEPELPQPKKEVERKPVFEVKEEKKELAPKVGFFKKITGFITGGITIGEGEVQPLLEDLRISLLESDVSLDTTEFLVEDLKKRLVGKQIARGSVNDAVKNEVKSALLDLFQTKGDFISEALKKEKPVKILFLGPNGAGKTTTIAKFAFLLKERGLKSVIAASDTFRAAAIEQAALHGERLGIEVIKHKYGADPSAVAFDAIAHAKAQKLDFVLIDTAGRQETNVNLLKEMDKINRVIKPDFKIFVGESIAGHALIDQAKKF